MRHTILRLSALGYLILGGLALWNSTGPARLSALARTTAIAAQSDPDSCAGAPNPIVCENAKPGNPKSEWDLPGAYPQYGDLNIQGFATEISVAQGETVHFKVNTTASAYRIDIYRLGYYRGLGARKVATVHPDVVPQDQPPCLFVAATRLVDCGNWAESASWDVPLDAVSGVYIGKLVREEGQQGVNHIIFVVRDDFSQSDLLVQTSDTAWQAYNRYGGYSLYYPSGSRAYKVSYNRPFITRNCCDETYFFSAEYPMVRWLEANGFNASYFTGVDTARRGNLIQQHRIFMSLGHDEYWSGEQRANVDAARAAGINLAFFSGNEIFWKTRWEASVDEQAVPFRTLVTYKETHANAKIDPSPQWTGTWRDPRFSPPADGGRPENALTGTLFMVNCCASQAESTYPITVSEPYGKLRLWRNTSVATLPTNGVATFPAGTLGYEWDEVIDNGALPPGLALFSATTRSVPSRLVDYGNTFAPGTATHHLVMYRHQSGALVFGAGTVRWAWGLDGTHDYPPTTPDVRMQQATVNILADMNAQPGSLQAGLSPADPSTDTVPPTSTVNQPAPGTTFAVQERASVSGSAMDLGGGLVAGVEVSVDGGVTWHPASGWSPGVATWTHSWTPTTPGTITIKSRAVDDSANLETPASGVNITVIARTCPCSIWANSVTPTVPSSSDTSANELGLKFRTDTTGYVTGVRFYKGTANTGTHVGHLWTRTGTLLGTTTFNNETASGWQQASFASPVFVTAGQTYVVSYYAPSGRYAQTISYFASSGVNNSPLIALATGVDGVNGVYKQGSSGFPSVAAYQSSNYWVDLVFALQPPPAPTGLTATAISSSDIYLSWTASTGATSYRVDRSIDNGTTWTTIGTASSPAYNDDGLTASTTYWYRVIAVSDGGSSAPSSTVSATTLVAPPAVPTGITAVAVSSTQINISWGASTGAASYALERAADDQGNWMRILTTAATSVSDSGLPPDTTFSYRVIATNAGGESAPSAIATATTFAGAPSAPANVSASTVSTSQIGVAWNGSSGATGYRVERSTNGGASWTTAGTSVVTNFLDGGLSPATTYYYRVFAANSGGESPPSGSAFATTLPLPPSPPAGLTATATGPTLVDLAWQASPGATSYQVERSADNGSTWTTIATTNPTAHSDSTVAPATTYAYRVRATNSGGASAPSTGVTVTTPPLGQCPCSVWDNSTVPSVPATSDASSNELGLKFRTDTSGYITGVRFYKGTTNTGAHVGHLWTRTGTMLGTVTFANETSTGWQQASFASPVAVTAGQTYIVSYYAPAGHYAQTVSYFATTGVNRSPLIALAAGVDGANGVYKQGTSGFPSVAGFQSSNYWVDVVFTPTVTPPPKPVGVVATSTSSSSITVSWSASTGASSYRTETSTDGGSSWSTAGTTTTTTLNHTGLTSASTYAYRVIAINAAGESTPSDTVAATTRPLPPASITATAASSTQIDVSWSASVGAISYRIEQSANGGATWSIAGTGTGLTFSDTGLAAATTYGYRVIAVGTGGDSLVSATATATTSAGPPSPPTGVTATAVSSSEIDLSWAASVGATGYQVERSSDGGANWSIAGTTTSTVLKDVGLNAEATYAYRVIATSAAGNSNPSSTATATTPTAPPSAPTGVTATAISSTEIQVGWTSSSGATGYRVERTANGGSTWTQVGTTTASSFHDTGLTPATTYDYRVFATNAGGESSPSAVATATTIVAPPATPTGVSATAISSTAIDVIWTASSGATSYRIERSINGGTSWMSAGTALVSPYHDTGLTVATTYAYRVTATNSGGDSNPSGTATATTLVDPPAAPTGVTASAVSSTQVDVAWAASGGATGYRIERSTNGGSSWGTAGTTPTTVFNDSGRAPDTQYWYRVFATNSGGDSLPSGVVTATTPPGAPSPPAGVTATTFSSSAIDITWTASASATSYRVERSADAGASWVEAVTTGTTSFRDSGLAASTTYGYRVVATNAGGDSSPSSTATATTFPPAPPAPAGVSATGISSTRIDVTWSASGGATGYRAERSADGGGSWTVAGTTANRAFSDTGLAPSTTYVYRIVATNSGGDSPPSVTATATTLQAPPAAPASLTATVVSSTAIDLAWQASTGATGYRVERSANGGASWTIAGITSGATTLSDTGLTPATTYIYRVIASNAGGDSAPSATATASTQVAPPATPTGLTATAVSSTQINTVWQASAGATGYRLERSSNGGSSWTTAGTTASTSLNDAGLTASTTYVYRVIGTNAGGESAPSSTATATTLVTPPAVPTGLSASAASSTQINLTWQASAGATGYRVERSTDGGASWATAGTSTATAFSNTGLTAATTYSYRVVATNAGGGSAPSTTATATTLTNAPTGVTATAFSSTQINVAWQATTGATSYRVERSSNGGSAWSTATMTTATAFSDIGLTPATTYTYRVFATNVGGESAPSALVSATTLAAGQCPCSLWDSSATPVTLTSSDATKNELGLKFRVDTAGFVTGIRFYKGSTNTGVHVGHLWTRTGTLLGTVTFTNETASGWQQANFASPIAVSAGQTYIVSYYAPNGHYSRDLSYFATTGVDRAPLHALANGVDGANGVYKNNASGFPASTYQSSNYWVDVVFTP